MPRSLPSQPSLHYLKQEAKDLLKAHDRGDASCCETLRLLDRFTDKSDADILAVEVQLTEAQYALAMDYGFKSWPEMRAHIAPGASEHDGAPQQVTPVAEFAATMLTADKDFASRVAAFETRFGSADASTLALLAQAAFLCDVHCDTRVNFLELGEAIGSGSLKSSIYHCGQISQESWDRLHTHVIAAQRWCGLDRPLPSQIDGNRADTIVKWLGPTDAPRRALVTLFLNRLIGRLLDMTFSRLGWIKRVGGSYTDYSGWYRGPDGVKYPADDQDLLHTSTSHLQELMGDDYPVAREIIAAIYDDGPPPCVCKYSRYLDIQCASIGAMKLRGALPEMDPHTVAHEEFLQEAKKAMLLWREGLPAEGDLGTQVQRLLGPFTDRKEAILFGFLNTYQFPGSRECSEPACDWVGVRDHDAKYDAGRLFQEQREEPLENS